MLRFGLLVLAAGCGGAGGLMIGDMPDVQIAAGAQAPRCMLNGPDSAVVTVEGLFTLVEGNTLDASIDIVGFAGAGMVTEFFSCGSWRELFNGSQDSVGCERDFGAPISMQAVNITHDETVTNGIPVDSMVTITLNVRDGTSPNVLATDSAVIGCN